MVEVVMRSLTNMCAEVCTMDKTSHITEKDINKEYQLYPYKFIEQM